MSVVRARNICFVSHTTFVLRDFDHGKVRYDRNTPIVRIFAKKFAAIRIARLLTTPGECFKLPTVEQGLAHHGHTWWQGNGSPGLTL